MDQIIWNVKDIVEVIKGRQDNEFDGNIAVSGNRGDGKSTLINKILYRFKKFNPKKHQVYSRADIIYLLKYQTYGYCWDDEAINTGYKRDFQNRGQQELIKILTAYRDNFNVYMSAIPNFFSLDKDLRELYFIHFHVIERGIAVVHMPLQGRLYSQDRWDSKYNSKIEETWSKRIKKNPSFKAPYHKLSTFRGYLYFNDLTKKQRDLYKEVKKTKRAESFQTTEEKKASIEVSFLDKVFNQLIERKLTRDGLIQACLISEKKYSTVLSQLNGMLTDKGYNETVKDFLLDKATKVIHSKIAHQIDQIIPDIT